MLTEFLTELFESGRVRVSGEPATNSDDLATARETLIRTEELAGRALPHGVPDFLPEVALEAGQRVWDAARFLVYRDIDPVHIRSTLGDFRPKTNRPDEHYSADLCLRFMKDVLRLSRATAENDPLNQAILELLAEWPLAAVGTSADVRSLSVIFDHRALRLMYLDRVVRLNDTRAMQQDNVRTALNELAGAQPELLPRGVEWARNRSDGEQPGPDATARP